MVVPSLRKVKRLRAETGAIPPWAGIAQWKTQAKWHAHRSIPNPALILQRFADLLEQIAGQIFQRF